MSSNQRFEKTVACPTNELLLEFLQNDRGKADAEEPGISEHLSTCEFCELTLELLQAYPAQLVPTTAPPAVPSHIQQLFPKQRVHK